jgi:hypothetical protein
MLLVRDQHDDRIAVEGSPDRIAGDGGQVQKLDLKMLERDGVVIGELAATALDAHRSP